MNIDKQPEEIKNKYTQYTKEPNKFGIKVYKIYQHTHYIFTDLENHNICLFDDQIELQQNLENYNYRINTPTLDKYEIDIYDTCFDILAGDVATEALMQKLEDCLTYTNDLKYTYFPIPPNQEQWPCVISSLVNVLKKEQDFSTSLEKLLCNIYSKFKDPVRYVIEDFKINFPVDNLPGKEKFHYEFFEKTIVPLAKDSSIIEMFLQALNDYITKENLFNKNNAIRLLMILMEKIDSPMIYSNKDKYFIKYGKSKSREEDTYAMQLVHAPIKLKRSFSQEF